MKLLICILLATMSIVACKNKQSDQDSVRIAKEVNKDKADTGRNIPMNKDTVAATMAVQKADADFAVEAANDNMIAIQLGGLAKTKAVNTRVKDFAMMMIKDHMKINEGLKKIATAKNISLPEALSKEAGKDIDNLSRKERANFDRAYINMMVADHRKELNKFEKAAKDCKDPDLKSFIEETLPVLRKLRDSAHAIDKVFVNRTPEPGPAYP